MKQFLHNIRFYILISNILFSIGIYLWIVVTIPSGILQQIRLQQIYALLAVLYVYLAMLVVPFCSTFKDFSYNVQFLKARRAFVVSAFYFGFLHAYISFFDQLGGLEGLGFLGQTYLIAVSLSFTALIILSVLALTSFDWVVAKMTARKWKLLQGFIYVAGILILIHALMLGTHFQNLSDTIPTIFFVAIAFLSLLEASRLDTVLRKLFPIPYFGLSFVIFSVLLGVLFFVVINPIFSSSNGSITFDIHAAHKKLAEQVTQPSSNPFQQIPGLRGDRTKRFTVSFDHPESILANQDVALSFRINDAASGNPTEFFEKIYEKPMHMIVVDSSLSYFNHIHPTQTADGFTITTQFPKDGRYHIYIDFQPFGAIEQQFAFTLSVGNGDTPIVTTRKPDTKLTKTVGEYQVILTKPNLVASEMSLGQQTLSFIIKDAKTKKPITTLKPYLASFGHLVMINQKTFEYVHVHPTNLTAPAPNANGGPTVEFLPIGIYGPFKPGIYRAFAQFNPDNNLFTADYTVQVK